MKSNLSHSGAQLFSLLCASFFVNILLLSFSVGTARGIILAAAAQLLISFALVLPFKAKNTASLSRASRALVSAALGAQGGALAVVIFNAVKYIVGSALLAAAIIISFIAAAVYAAKCGSGAVGRASLFIVFFALFFTVVVIACSVSDYKAYNLSGLSAASGVSTIALFPVVEIELYILSDTRPRPVFAAFAAASLAALALLSVSAELIFGLTVSFERYPLFSLAENTAYGRFGALFLTALLLCGSIKLSSLLSVFFVNKKCEHRAPNSLFIVFMLISAAVAGFIPDAAAIITAAFGAVSYFALIAG